MYIKKIFLFASCSIISIVLMFSCGSKIKTQTGLYGLVIDSAAHEIKCRTIPFLACNFYSRGKSIRVMKDQSEIIPVGLSAEMLYFSGMTNGWYDYGVAHWVEHPEIKDKRDDQVYIGVKIGDIKIVYQNGQQDDIPLIMGVTTWWVAQWAYGPTHNYKLPINEPFVSNPAYAKTLSECLLVNQSDSVINQDNQYCFLYLSVKPKKDIIKEIQIIDNPDKRGSPMISGITLLNPSLKDKLHWFGKCQVEVKDIQVQYDVNKGTDFSSKVRRLSQILYTHESDLPHHIEPLSFPQNMHVTQIHFTANVVNGVDYAQMLNNIWVSNLMNIDQKVERQTGFLQEDCKDCQWYGGYSGIGTFKECGIYFNHAYARTADHLATIALRNIDDTQRNTKYVDFVDKWLYYYRHDHNLANGPENRRVDTVFYPADAPPHWAMEINQIADWPVINELSGDEEMDGHGCTMISRWYAWRINGAPIDNWLTSPRKDVYGKSRWQSTADAANFVCWLMDYTAQDVIWSEGEIDCWGMNGTLTPGMSAKETNRKKILQAYEHADMYELYPSFACMIALECSSQIARSLGKIQQANKWEKYALRISNKLIARLTFNTPQGRIWRVCKNSVWPAYMESLCEAYLSIYHEGLDKSWWNQEFSQITENTFKVRAAQKPHYAQVLGMGYGQGWLTHSALVLDQMDIAGKCLVNIAKYSYDKNTDFVSDKVNWKRWMWLIPEGTNILPDSSWYRIGDLTNGANQGPCIHAIELCAGLDDIDPLHIKILPRIPSPLTAIEVKNLYAMIPSKNGLQKISINYSFKKNEYFHLQASNSPYPSCQ